MALRKIQRPVRVLDTSSQFSLFTDIEREAGMPPATTTLRVAGRVQFVAPGPCAIFINQVRLDEHLQATGLKTPLRLRPFLEALSFAEFETSYRPGGRPPYALRAIVGLTIYGILQGISSLRDLERCARSDLGCWWLTGGIMPDHSVIGRFVQQHRTLLTEAFFEHLVRQVLRVTGSGTAVVAGDGTVIEATASRFRLLKEEALREAVVPPQMNSKDFRVHLNSTSLPTRPASFWPATCIPPARPSRWQHRLDRAEALGPINTALFDAGYFSEGVIRTTAARGIELLSPEGQSVGTDWNKHADTHLPKSRLTQSADEDV